MTSQATPALEPISDERLNEILAGLEGVTPGPWFSDGIKSDGDYGTGEDVVSGFETYAVFAETGSGRPMAICDALNSDVGAVEEEYGEDGHSAWDGQGKKNMAHVARCDPDTIRAIVSELIQRRAPSPAPSGEGLVEDSRWLENARDLVARYDKAAENQKGNGADIGIIILANYGGLALGMLRAALREAQP